MNIKYLLSSRFTDGTAKGAANASLEIVKVFVSHLTLSEGVLNELLNMVANLKLGRHHYIAWTNCIGAFMTKLGGKKFFTILPLRLIEFDLNSLTYAQDSRSFLLLLIQRHLKIDANLDFFVEYFLPMILQLDKMRELEQKQGGS